jgi:hypothetical protein
VFSPNPGGTPRHSGETTALAGAGVRPFNWTVFFIHLGVWFAGGWLLMALSLFVIPRFIETIKDFRLVPPLPTRILLVTVRLARSLGCLLAPLPTVHALLAAGWYPTAGPDARRLYRLVIIFGTIGLVGFASLAIVIPWLLLRHRVVG